MRSPPGEAASVKVGKGVGTRGDNGWLTSSVPNNSRESEGEEKTEKKKTPHWVSLIRPSWREQTTLGVCVGGGTQYQQWPQRLSIADR